MKKIPLFLKILIPAFVVSAIVGVFFGVKLINTSKTYDDRAQQAASIEAIAPAERRITYNKRKEQSGFEYEETVQTDTEDALATYQNDNITFISYSEVWDEENLEKLADELLSNVHGSEMDYLAQVLVYGNEDDEALGSHHSNYDSLKIALKLFSMTPYGFTFSVPNTTSILTLHNGDTYATIEQMALTLSHEYGHHFTLHYFNLMGDDTEIENSPYFKARYMDELDIRYTEEDFDDNDEYLENHKWYLIEIAADDYVYLMGSPNTRRIINYIDTLDQLRLDNKGKDDELDEYYKTSNEYSFNEAPHENILLPLPHQVPGLPELFYNAIGLEAPQYVNRQEKADDIEIEITRKSSHGERYYNVTWNKPWSTSDIIYTLVAYDENDDLLGAIKSINGKDKARAIIGGAVLNTSSHSWTWYDSDYWTDQGFLRFRVIVTFSDGYATISPFVDRSFS